MIFRIPHTRFKSQRPPSTGRDLGPAASFGNREGGRRCWKEETRATVAGYVKDASELVQGHFVLLTHFPFFILSTLERR
ncbi:hypothetical protein TNCV_3285351 [Trichonephila clavipes]|nr:hypothetical protein TNCV_3285351 [Trichonephila clavipes]